MGKVSTVSYFKCISVGMLYDKEIIIPKMSNCRNFKFGKVIHPYLYLHCVKSFSLGCCIETIHSCASFVLVIKSGKFIYVRLYSQFLADD
ncbi:MAG: hypothetical protein V2A65_11425 [Candidatus Omnitrophota bacterium]